MSGDFCPILEVFWKLVLYILKEKQKKRLNMDSKKLYTQIEEKDEQIFFAFWKDHLRLFYKIAQTIMLPKCSESDIEDCLQESMIYMWKHLKDYDPERYSLKNWASMIVASRAKNWITSP